MRHDSVQNHPHPKNLIPLYYLTRVGSPMPVRQTLSLQDSLNTYCWAPPPEFLMWGPRIYISNKFLGVMLLVRRLHFENLNEASSPFREGRGLL